MKYKRIIAIVIVIIGLFILYKNKKVEYKCNDAGISYEEFQKIQTGDSQFAVNEIVDPNDKLDNNKTYENCIIEVSKENKNSVYNYTYKYIGEKGGYAILTFTADYSNGDSFVMPGISKKEQYNLK